MHGCFVQSQRHVADGADPTRPVLRRLVATYHEGLDTHLTVYRDWSAIIALPRHAGRTHVEAFLDLCLARASYIILATGTRIRQTYRSTPPHIPRQCSCRFLPPLLSSQLPTLSMPDHHARLPEEKRCVQDISGPIRTTLTSGAISASLPHLRMP